MSKEQIWNNVVRNLVLLATSRMSTEMVNQLASNILCDLEVLTDEEEQILEGLNEGNN